MLLDRCRQQRLLGRRAKDRIEIVYHVRLIRKSAPINDISPGRSMASRSQSLLDARTASELFWTEARRGSR
jgi:hypothetical protein